MKPFWKKFSFLIGISAIIVPVVSYLLSLIGVEIGIDLLLIVLFGFALQVLVEAETPTHYNLVAFYFIALSTYGSGAMAYSVKTEQIAGWEWILAMIDIAVVLASTTIGTRCFYEAVIAQRSQRKQ